MEDVRQRAASCALYACMRVSVHCRPLAIIPNSRFSSLVLRHHHAVPVRGSVRRLAALCTWNRLVGKFLRAGPCRPPYNIVRRTTYPPMHGPRKPVRSGKEINTRNPSCNTNTKTCTTARKAPSAPFLARPPRTPLQRETPCQALLAPAYLSCVMVWAARSEHADV
jgi:hypothetical protein